MTSAHALDIARDRPCSDEQACCVGGTCAAEPNQRGVGQVVGWGVLGSVTAVVLVAAAGERLGLFDRVLARVPWWLPALAIAIGGWPVFRGVILASRRALAQLVRLAPMTARVTRDGYEVEVAVEQVSAGELVLVRPGERIPVDGEVVDGTAPVDEAAVTGESVPQDKAVGDRVFAATVAQAGFLMVRAMRVGADTTFARIVRLVEEAEARKAPVQKFADRFAGYYLPVVAALALVTLLVTGEVLNAVAVVVVACACAIVIATPVVVLASVAAAARRGLLIKGGIALEQLARVDTVVLDKTGTLTYGQPAVTDVVPLNGLSPSALLAVVATAEGRSEHPLAGANVRAAQDQRLTLGEPTSFTALPGRGVIAQFAGTEWVVGNRRLLADRHLTPGPEVDTVAAALESRGKTVFFAARATEPIGLVAVADTVRPEALTALTALKRLGITRLLLLTGDNERVAKAIAEPLGLDYRAGLLPEEKIAAIRDLQARGRVVLMVGDGINDAPALAQADVGVAMGVAGTDVAMEAADVALMRDDWSMVPEAIRLGRRATRTIRQNLAFTAIYNLVGIGLAALGLLPPVWAAAAQSLPDVAIMLNSARLLRSGK